MKNRLNAPCLVLCLFLAALLGNGCSHKKAAPTAPASEPAQYHGEQAFFGSAKVKRYSLANGMKILVLEDHSSPTFSYQTWFNVGSRDEEKGLTGLAHLFEHMMFKATSNYPDGHYSRALEAVGTTGLNAFTSHDYTGYIQNLPSNQLELIVKLESDRMVNLLVNDESLNKERDVVHNERRFRNENSPDGTMYETIFKLAFPGHPYGWPIIGYAQDLENAKAKECLEFYRNHYAPNNATLVVVGDVNPDRLVSLVEKHYGHYKAQPVRHYNGPDAIPTLTTASATLKLPLSVEKLFVGYRIPPATSKETPALEMLATLFGHTQSSRLYQRLVDGGIAASVDSGNDSHKGPGLFLITASMQKGRAASAALSAIDSEVSKLIRKGITPAEMSAALNQYKFELFGDLESNYSKARNLGFFETVTGTFENGPKLIAAMEQLTPQDVLNVAKRYLRPQNRVVVIGQPKGK